MTDAELADLEMLTRAQSLSNRWLDERKIRITSSFFGRICKTREVSSFANIIKCVREQRYLKTPAIMHGRQYEEVVKQEYTKITKTICQPAGLFVHKKYQFLAASPDGLVGEDGLVEIKCPFNARHNHPNEHAFDFLDSNGETIKAVHNYHYQIQGLLEITDRSWCDLVIYTEKGTKIIRVTRNRRFWASMLNKLKKFYLFYMLPHIVCPENKFSELERKWRTNEDLEFLENGLIAASDYYKELPNKRGYIVTCVQT